VAELKAGLTDELRWPVTEDLCTTRGGRHVLSTPAMVLFVERSAIRLLEPHLAPGQSSVGTRIDIRHLAPTLAGMSVRSEVELATVDGRKLGFKVKVFDDVEQVGEADHERVLIDVAKYVGRVEKKAASVLPAPVPPAVGALDPDSVEVDADRETGIARVTINRPDKHNVITQAMRVRLCEAVEQLGRQPWVRVIVIRGTGDKAFSAGADMNEFLSFAPHEHGSLHALMSAPERVPQPVIAAIDGFCFGGALELALACDFRIVTTRAQLALPEIRLGMMPGSGGGQRVLRLVGMSRAKLFCMTGMRVDGVTAAAWGLATKAVEPDRLAAEVDGLARDLASLAPLAVRMVKSALDRGADSPLPSALEMEGKMYATIKSTADYREGVMAWQEKRAPKFTGR
jgi:2-oxoglutaroyl-CoA hydrolase